MPLTNVTTDQFEVPHLASQRPRIVTPFLRTSEINLVQDSAGTTAKPSFFFLPLAIPTSACLRATLKARGKGRKSQDLVRATKDNFALATLGQSLLKLKGQECHASRRSPHVAHMTTRDLARGFEDRTDLPTLVVPEEG